MVQDGCRLCDVVQVRGVMRGRCVAGNALAIGASVVHPDSTDDLATVLLSVALKGELVGIVDNDAIVNVHRVTREVLLVQ